MGLDQKYQTKIKYMAAMESHDKSPCPGGPAAALLCLAGAFEGAACGKRAPD